MEKKTKQNSKLKIYISITHLGYKNNILPNSIPNTLNLYIKVGFTKTNPSKKKVEKKTIK